LKKLTRNDYYARSGFDDLKKRRVRRHALYADALAAADGGRRRVCAVLGRGVGEAGGPGQGVRGPLGVRWMAS